MAAETRAMSIRGIPSDLYSWLKIRAAQHDRSMEAEARAIFIEAKKAEESVDNSAGAFFDRLREKYGTFDDIPIPPRTDSPARWVDFSE